MTRAVVLDASVGVKWFVPEAGTDDALAIARDHVAGRVAIAVDPLFLYEVLAVVDRKRGADRAREAWDALLDLRVSVAESNDALMRATLDARGRFGCSLYDASCVALANLLGAELVSADRRAHGEVPGVRLIGA